MSLERAVDFNSRAATLRGLQLYLAQMTFFRKPLGLGLNGFEEQGATMESALQRYRAADRANNPCAIYDTFYQDGSDERICIPIHPARSWQPMDMLEWAKKAGASSHPQVQIRFSGFQMF